eukprot:GHVN01035811.1.p1 GENE.GHVN01035811.1~~GHVN01035811.1.p1  ORF type:complete len:217 (+),score=48.23 GHVN01035811.1:44-652(+)
MPSTRVIKAKKVAEGHLSEDAKASYEIVKKVCNSPETTEELWKRLDANCNDISSLAEIEALVKGLAADRSDPPKYEGFFVDLYHKKPLLRAYYCTTEKCGDGDAFVQRDEFVPLLRNIYFFDKLWKYFDKIDSDNDKRVDMDEFKDACKKFGFKLSDKEAEDAFGVIDENGGGKILFDEFCLWCIAALGLTDDQIAILTKGG